MNYGRKTCVISLSEHMHYGHLYAACMYYINNNEWDVNVCKKHVDWCIDMDIISTNCVYNTIYSTILLLITSLASVRYTLYMIHDRWAHAIAMEKKEWYTRCIIIFIDCCCLFLCNLHTIYMCVWHDIHAYFHTFIIFDNIHNIIINMVWLLDIYWKYSTK